MACNNKNYNNSIGNSVWHVSYTLPATTAHMNEEQGQSKCHTNGAHNNVGNAQEWILTAQHGSSR